MNAAANPIPARRYLIAIGSFENPSSTPLAKSNIGAGFSEAIRQQLAKQNRLDPQVDAAVGREVTDALALSESQRARRLWQIWRAHPSLDWVLTGSVRKFGHVAQSPSDLSAWGPSRNHMQATVKITSTLVDLCHGTIISSDELSGVAWTNETPAPQTYRGITFGSYQYWQTPLGLASREVIDQLAARIERAVPAAGPAATPIRIVQQVDSRRVRLTENALEHASEGDVMYVCAFSADGLSLRTVDDSQTRQPLMARIEPRRLGHAPTARLTGEKPANTNLRGAVLTRQRPERASSTSTVSAWRSR